MRAFVLACWLGPLVLFLLIVLGVIVDALF